MSRGLEIVNNTLIELGISADEVKSDALLLDDLAIDSTELVEVVFIIEGKIHQEIDEKQFKHFRTVADLVRYVDEKLAIAH